MIEGTTDHYNDIPQKNQVIRETKIGLVKRAISGRAQNSRKSHAKIEVYADIVEVPVISRSHLHKKPPNSTQRGTVTEFSKRSRVRMMREIAKIRDMSNGYFVTLTYPGRWNLHEQVPKQHLSAIRKRLERKFPLSGTIWRLELKKRKTGASMGQIVPHFHLVIFGTGVKKKELIKWMSENWNDIVDPEDKDHLKAGTNVRRIKNRRHVMAYVSKYIAKHESDEDRGAWGRRWGMFGKLDKSMIYSIEIDRSQFIKMREMVIGVLRSEVRQRIMKIMDGKPRSSLGENKREKIISILRKRYYKRLKTKETMRGFAVMGLGDLSQNPVIWQIVKSTFSNANTVTQI